MILFVLAVEANWHQQPGTTGGRDVVAAAAAELLDAHQHNFGRADD